MSIHFYKTALVTGAASGIGAACVNMLRRHDLHVVAIDRHVQKLADLSAETGCETVTLDIRETEELIRTLAGRDFDILINNAGLAHGIKEGFLGMESAHVDEMIDVNVTAALHILRIVLPSMVARKQGHVVETGSIAGLYPLGRAVYGATKGAIHSLSRHLRMELSGSKIKHTEICPGRTITDFFDSALSTEEERKAFISEYVSLSPQDIADAIEYALCTPLHVNVSTIEIVPVDQAPGGQIWG